MELWGCPLYSTDNDLDKLISGRDYTATVRGCYPHNKLLYVNSESRQEALKFYLVHIPYYLRISEDRTERTIKSNLYFNSQYGFMFLKVKHPPEHTFVDFLYDLAAYDPNNI